MREHQVIPLLVEVALRYCEDVYIFCMVILRIGERNMNKR